MWSRARKSMSAMPKNRTKKAVNKSAEATENAAGKVKEKTDH